MRRPKTFNPDTESKIGARVRASRLLAGLTQQEVAFRLGLTFQQLQKYENGTNRISVSRLQEIAAIVNQPLSFFFMDGAFDDAALGQRIDIEIARLAAQLPPESRRVILSVVRALATVNSVTLTEAA